MLKLLLNANLSPKTAEFLRKLGFDVKCLLEEGLGSITDDQVINIAKKEKRVIVTFDLDFGEIYHFREEGRLGIIVVRLKNQTVESVNKALKKFFKDIGSNLDQLSKGLTVVEERRYRRA